MNTGYSIADCYNFTVEYALQHKGNTPSQRQIAANCGFSSATAYNCIKLLIKQGMLERIDGELCVRRSNFDVEPDAARFTNGVADQAVPRSDPQLPHQHPIALIDMLGMQYIPKDIKGISKKQLVKLGIGILEIDDPDFWRAAYPLGWMYEVIPDSTDKLLLVDAKGQYRAMLNFHDEGATITFL